MVRHVKRWSLNSEEMVPKLYHGLVEHGVPALHAALSGLFAARAAMHNAIAAIDTDMKRMACDGTGLQAA